MNITCIIKFPIERGRWGNIPKEERIFRFCGTGLGDEYHYFCECNKNLRRKLIPP